MPNPLDHPDLYDFILLGGKKSPGLAAVGGASSPREWDEKKGYGLSGASITYTGDGLAKFTVTFFAWTTEHFEQWESFKVLFKKTPQGTKPKAYDISYPWLEDLEIQSVVITDYTQWEESGDTGMFKREAKFLQNRQPQPNVGKPQGSQSKPQEPTAADAADKTIEDLIKQVKELSS